MIPPIYADEGKVRIRVSDIAFSAEIDIQPEGNSTGRPAIVVKTLQPEVNSDKVEIKVECYSDLTRHVVDEYLFYKDFKFNRLLHKY